MQPYTKSRPLPPYRVVFAVDTRNFTANPGVTHAGIAEEIPELLAAAFLRVGKQEIWRQKWELGHSGDGLALAWDPEFLPFLIHPVLDGIQEQLAERNAGSLRYQPIVRLRASLNIGPLTSGGGDPGDGNGIARNDTHRLLDSDPVRRELADASEQVTHLAAILSNRVYEDAVLAGYTGLHPDLCVPVEASVSGKDFRQQAWIYVPRRSGAPAPAQAQAAPALATASAVEPPRPTAHVRAKYGQAIGTVAGDNRQSLHIHRKGER
jgi:hypothetical protein